jgi:hypothetical protein
MTIEDKNPFLEISEGGYILSDDTKSLLLELAENFKDQSDFFIRTKSISQKFDYDHRICIVLLYLDYALTDNLISSEEFSFIEDLKKAFSIIPGDFYNKKYSDVQRVLLIQFHLYYLDNDKDFEESLEIGYLQGIFDLDSAQIASFEIKEREK